MKETGLVQNNDTDVFPYIQDDVIFRRLDTPTGYRAELFATNSSASAEINPAAEEILIRCDGQHSIDRICREISAKYGMDQAQAKVKIETVLQPLQKKAFIETHEYSNKARQIKDVVKTVLPLNSIFFECTLRCNLKCVHCYAYDPQCVSKDMDLETICSLIDQFADMGGTIMTISGGEPLMRKDIFDIIEYAIARPLNVQLLTNGVLVDRAVAKRLKDTGITDVQISLDGSEAASHDTYRGVNGAFDKTVAGITFLHEEGITAKIGAILNKINIAQVFELVDLCQRWGVVPNFGMQQAQGRANGEGKPYELSFHEYSSAMVNINKYLGEKYGVDRLTLFSDAEKKCANRCNAGVSNLAIMSNGDVWPCRDFIGSGHLLGNIAQDKLLDIWNGEQPILKTLRKHTIGDINLCSECKHVNYCGSGCPLDALQQWGDYHWPDIQRCVMMKLMEGVASVKKKNTTALKKTECTV